MLSWVMNCYPGPELMSHPDLQVDLSNLEPLINERSLKELENEYLKVISKRRIFNCITKRLQHFPFGLQIMEKNYEDWMTKTIETEKQEWMQNSLPDHDGQDKYYQTSSPVIIFQMIDQHLQVTNTIHSEFTFSALVLSIQQVTKFGHNYRQCIIEFKDKHFKDRSQVSHFRYSNH